MWKELLKISVFIITVYDNRLGYKPSLGERRNDVVENIEFRGIGFSGG